MNDWLCARTHNSGMQIASARAPIDIPMRLHLLLLSQRAGQAML
jgi:hypothetical protein